MFEPSVVDEPATSLEGSGLVRVRLHIAYDGSNFYGWAKQPALRTVQEELERGLHTILRLDSPISVTVAGRTDTGVHATGQVTHFDVPVDSWARVPGRSQRSAAAALCTRLAGVLPHDLVALEASEVSQDFDARFGALWRSYEYCLADAISLRDPRTRSHVVWYRNALDVQAMNEAATSLVGERDWAAFCKRRDGATTIRTLQEYSWSRRPDGILRAVVRADAFCHHMVRALVGACVAVGEGRRDVTWPLDIAEAGVKSSAVQVMEPHGLTLTHVEYPAATEWKNQAKATRRVRTLPGSEGELNDTC